MDLYELLGEELADNDMTITATADYGTPLVSLHRSGLDRVEAKIRADERERIATWLRSLKSQHGIINIQFAAQMIKEDKLS